MSTGLSAGTTYDNGAPLLYNVAPWNSLGFGVPNFGARYFTQNQPIARFVDEVGKVQLFIMAGNDARRGGILTANTVMRIAKLVNRAQTLLAGRQKQPNDQVLEPGHAVQSGKIFNIHPVPYFDSPMLKNPWLKEYNELVMVALTNMMLYTDNDRSLTITSDFAAAIWQYFKEIKVLCCTELLGMTQADASDDSKPMPTGPYAGPGVLVGSNPSQTATTGAAAQPTYNPPATVVNTEVMQSPGPSLTLPGPADMQPLFDGIPANLIIPNLAQYPVGPLPGLSGIQGAALPSAQGLVGVGAVSGPGGAMGSPLGVTPAAQAVLDAVNANIAAGGGQSSAGQAASPQQVAGTIAQPSV